MRSSDDSNKLKKYPLTAILVVSFNLLMLHGLTHISLPRARQHTKSFVTLSYYDSSTQKYAQGPGDFYFVGYWILLFTFLRAFVLSYVLLPLARFCGVEKIQTRIRFAEQAWLLLYYALFCPLGVVSHLLLNECIQ